MRVKLPDTSPVQPADSCRATISVPRARRTTREGSLPFLLLLAARWFAVSGFGDRRCAASHAYSVQCQRRRGSGRRRAGVRVFDE